MKDKIISKVKSIFTLRMAIALVLGALGGYAYYYFIGCSSGQCAITANPVNSMLYGTLVGAVIGYKEKKEIDKQDIVAED